MVNKRYTYIDFAHDCIALANNEPISVDKDIFIEKAECLEKAQTTKSEYSATHQKKSTPKGASDKTLATIAVISPIITTTPITTNEINAKLKTSYTPLQISNAVRYMSKVTSCKVIREVITPKGLRSEKEYTAYYLSDNE